MLIGFLVLEMVVQHTFEYDANRCNIKSIFEMEKMSICCLIMMEICIFIGNKNIFFIYRLPGLEVNLVDGAKDI